MKIKKTTEIAVSFFAAFLLTHPAPAQTTFSQNTTNNCATGTNLVEQSATTLTVATFRNDVAIAWTNDAGGVFDLPTVVGAGTTVYRGAYGKTAAKRMQMTSSVSMQNSAANGNTIFPISNPNVTTSSANQSDYNMTLGLFDTNTGLPVSSEIITEIGFVVLSRTAAAWPLDVQATATFSDGSTLSAKTNILAGRGVDDTFYGFTAPAGLSITNIRLQSFSPGTSTPVADRMSWDDFGFITSPAAIVLAPQIYNVTPINYAIADATAGIHFQALTYVSVPSSNISLTLNSNDVSSQLVFTGSSTNYSVAYNGLVPDQNYTMTISASNSAGIATLTQTFSTATTYFTVYDSGGFTDDTLYPAGNLMNVTNGQAVWTPNPTEPAQIIDLGAPQGKVLQRQNTGATRTDVLSFPPISTGTIIEEFDADVSTSSGRTIDICLQPTTGGTMGSFLSWGQVAGEISYFDNVNWDPIAAVPSDWHHVKIVNYLSGPAAGKYDVFINGSPVAQKINFRNAPIGSPFNQFRLESVNTGPFFEYGNIDNLVITAGPTDQNAYPPPTITNVIPFGYAVINPANGVQFQVQSQIPITASNVSLMLNSNDVSSQLVATGSGTNLSLSFSNLAPNQTYTLQITASNTSGTVAFSNSFYAYTNDFVLYDSGGFTDDTLYPLGPLGAVTNGLAYWVPAASPSQVVDSGDSNYGKVLERAQVGTDQIDNLKFQPISSGVITYSFDARISDPTSRCTDFSLEDDGSAMTSFILLATNAVNYVVPGGGFVPGPSLDTGWHHYKVVNRLSGASSNSYDLYFDGVLAVAGAGWRTAIAVQQNPLDKLRYGAIRGTVNVYGDMDNLLVTAGPERLVVLPVTLTAPAATPTTFTFSFQSQNSVNYAAQYTTNLAAPNNWNTFQTIAGDGTIKTVTQTNTPSSAAYYRVTTQ